MIATQTIVLYKPSIKSIIAEVYENEQYHISEDVEIYIGTLEDFLNENPDYNN